MAGSTISGCRDVIAPASGLGVFPLVEKSIAAGTQLAIAAAGAWASDEFDIMNAVNKTTGIKLVPRGCPRVCGGGMILDIWADQSAPANNAVHVAIFESIDLGGGLLTDGRFISPAGTVALRWSVRVTGPIVRFLVTNVDAANAATVQLGAYLRNA